MEFYLRGESIPTDGSGRLLITDISLHNGSISTSDEEALICHSSRDVAELHILPSHGDWYLDSEIESNTTTTSAERITRKDGRGWTRNRGNSENRQYRVARLKRVLETPVEGKFTCHIPKDDNNNRFLFILYPSKYSLEHESISALSLSPPQLVISVRILIEVDTEDQFRIKCISTGGRVLNMSITGPHGEALEDIQTVGTHQWMGDDSYSGSTGTLSGADDGDPYRCTASNGVSSADDSIAIRGDNDLQL